VDDITCGGGAGMGDVVVVVYDTTEGCCGDMYICGWLYITGWGGGAMTIVC